MEQKLIQNQWFGFFFTYLVINNLFVINCFSLFDFVFSLYFYEYIFISIMRVFPCYNSSKSLYIVDFNKKNKI